MSDGLSSNPASALDLDLTTLCTRALRVQVELREHHLLGLLSGSKELNTYNVS